MACSAERSADKRVCILGGTKGALVAQMEHLREVSANLRGGSGFVWRPDVPLKAMEGESLQLAALHVLFAICHERVHPQALPCRWQPPL